MPKRDSYPLTLHCSNEHDRDLLEHAIMTLKSIQLDKEKSPYVPPFSDVKETHIWAKTTIERCIHSGVWIDQEEEFNIR